MDIVIYSFLLLTLNRKKSEVLVLRPRFGASLPREVREVLGIAVRRSAKYLGLTYDVELRLKSSIRSFMPKISGVGEWRSARAEECYLLFQKTVWKTLRRMIRAPINASNEILDYLLLPLGVIISRVEPGQAPPAAADSGRQGGRRDQGLLRGRGGGLRVCPASSGCTTPERRPVREASDRSTRRSTTSSAHLTTQQPRVQGAPGEHSLPETSGPRPPQAAEPAAGGVPLCLAQGAHIPTTHEILVAPEGKETLRRPK